MSIQYTLVMMIYPTENTLQKYIQKHPQAHSLPSTPFNMYLPWSDCWFSLPSTIFTVQNSHTHTHTQPGLHHSCHARNRDNQTEHRRSSAVVQTHTTRWCAAVTHAHRFATSRFVFFFDFDWVEIGECYITPSPNAEEACTCREYGAGPRFIACTWIIWFGRERGRDTHTYLPTYQQLTF